MAERGWGPVELVAVIAGPLFLLCVLLVAGLCLFHHYHHQGASWGRGQRLDLEEPSLEQLYLDKDKTLQDFIYDMSTSGSGSG